MKSRYYIWEWNEYYNWRPSGFSEGYSSITKANIHIKECKESNSPSVKNFNMELNSKYVILEAKVLKNK